MLACCLGNLTLLPTIHRDRLSSGKAVAMQLAGKVTELQLSVGNQIQMRYV